MKLTQHFDTSEFECRCGCTAPQPVRDRWHSLATALEALRVKVDKPVTITSGYRCPTHNRDVGGARASQHLVGGAVDVTVESFDGRALAAILDALIASGQIPDGGIGLYADRPSIVHYDQRGRRARWGFTSP